MVRLIFAGINLALLCFLLLAGFFAYREAGNLYADNLLFISPLHDDEALRFSPSELEVIRASFPDYEIITSASTSAVFRGSVMQARGDVVFVSPGYLNIHFLDLLEGSKPRAHANTVLLSESLAWRVFGSLTVTGLTVWLGNELYTVSGVAAGGGLGYTAWVHKSAAPEMPVSSLYVRLERHNDADAFGIPREILSHARRNPDEFAILDIDRYVEAMGMRNTIILQLLWFVGLVAALLKLLKLASRVARKENPRANVPKTIAAACFAMVAAIVLFTGVNELILMLPNLSLPGASLGGFVFGWFTHPPSHLMSPAFARLVELNTRANFVFFGSLVAVVNILVVLNVARAHKQENV